MWRAPTTDAGDLVVTAERRTRSVQTTPISVTVLAGADLQKKGITSVDQLQFSMPSLTLQNFGQGNSFDIRGIGKGDGSSAIGVSAVITYRDGVATFPGYFQDETYYDLASIEVLRGPQGTFVGQNATGGAVFITEANPTSMAIMASSRASTAITTISRCAALLIYQLATPWRPVLPSTMNIMTVFIISPARTQAIRDG